MTFMSRVRNYVAVGAAAFSVLFMAISLLSDPTVAQKVTVVRFVFAAFILILSGILMLVDNRLSPVRRQVLYVNRDVHREPPSQITRRQQERNAESHTHNGRMMW